MTRPPAPKPEQTVPAPATTATSTQPQENRSRAIDYTTSPIAKNSDHTCDYITSIQPKKVRAVAN
jgi:hypothetical protein